MPTTNLLNALALFSLIPAAAIPLRSGAGRDAPFWLAIVLAVLGPAAWSAHLLWGAWQTGLSTTLWVSIAASALLFAVFAARTQAGWRLAPLLMPYLLALGFLASAVKSEARPLSDAAPELWVDVHIVVSVLTYALLTLAAVASLAVFLQERALKRKRPTRLTRMLPAVLESETLAGRVLLASEVVLGLGLATGMATQFLESGHLLRFDHKILLSIIAFNSAGSTEGVL